MEDRIINTVSLYGSSKQLCLAIPTPGLTIMGKTFKACFVQIDMKDIIELLGIDEQDRTYFAIYAKTGGNLSGTELGPVIGEHNFLDATKHLLPEDIWEDNENRFERGEKGNMDFSVKGIKETLCYAPVKGTGWELAVLIRESVILEQIRAISNRNLATSRNQIIFTLVALILLSVILLLEIKTLSKEKLEEQKEASRTFRDMATKDSLTGVRNKHAYSESEVVLDQRIQAGEIQKLAVVVCDINGLKIVNDTQGHAAGDQLIKDACAMICKYFNHGAVFRIGGDEFVVILQGVGFDTMTEVMDDLNHRFEENIQEDGVVVAMGSSVLKPEDQRLQDVFDRADAMMYERKKELKSVGAKTRAL
jgi:diguanylate cyclase (GGDEF)-like protein